MGGWELNALNLMEGTCIIFFCVTLMLLTSNLTSYVFEGEVKLVEDEEVLVLALRPYKTSK